MAEVKPPDLVVIKVLSPDEDRFVIVETVTAAFFRPFSEPGSTADRLEAMKRYFGALPRFSEADVRARLAERGMQVDAIDASIERARQIVRLAVQNGWSAPIELETITRIGYCNREGQEVVRKTERTGPSSQRVFVMRCRVCGHEYGSYGCDADIRRCPACQDGAPSVS